MNFASGGYVFPRISSGKYGNIQVGGVSPCQTKTQTTTRNINITINATTNATPEAISRAISKELQFLG